MHDVVIKDDPAAELRRLESTNFFRDQGEGESQSSYIEFIAQREASRFGTDDALVRHYIRLAGWARMVGK
jgi:hypothetical protein